MQPTLIALIEKAIKEAAAETAKFCVLEAHSPGKGHVRRALNAGRVQTLLEDSLLRARLLYGIGPQLPEERSM